MPLPNAVFSRTRYSRFTFLSRVTSKCSSTRSNVTGCFAWPWSSPTVRNRTSTEDFFHITTVGLIRACVASDNSTANLILQGLQHIRFTRFRHETLFPVAQVEALDSIVSSAVKTEALGAKVLELYERFKVAGRQLRTESTDISLILAMRRCSLISWPRRLLTTRYWQQVLEELSLDQRLGLVIQYLREEGGAAAA